MSSPATLQLKCADPCAIAESSRISTKLPGNVVVFACYCGLLQNQIRFKVDFLSYIEMCDRQLLGL